MFLSWQDFSQADKYLGKETRNAIVSNTATQSFGQISSYETAEYASKLFGKKYVTVKSTNKGANSSDSGDSQSSGQSYSEQQRDIVTPQEFITLPTGTFFGKTVESQESWYKVSFIRIQDQEEYKDFKEVPIPSFIETFHLNDADFNEIQKQVHFYDENPEKIFLSDNKNIIDLIAKYYPKVEELHEIELTEPFLLELKTVIKDNYKSEKTLKILTDNFKSIQADVRNLIEQYTITEEAE